MDIQIIAVGRMRDRPEAELWADYSTRAARQGRALGITGVNVREVADSRGSTIELRKAEEGTNLIAALPPSASIIALDRGGMMVSSREFAKIIKTRLEDGTGSVVILIGGPDGHGSQILERAHMTLSLGVMTWPHLLVRAMVAEQLYRTVTILAGHPYHRR